MQDALVVRRETHISAPRAAVFALLTDPEKILRWMGTEAQLEAQPGGLYLVNVTGARFARGSFSRGRAGASPGLQFWLGRQRGGAAGIEPGRDRPDGATAGRNAAAADPHGIGESGTCAGSNFHYPSLEKRHCKRRSGLPRARQAGYSGDAHCWRTGGVMSKVGRKPGA